EDNRPSLQGSREYPKTRIIIWGHGRLGDKAKVVGVNYTLRPGEAILQEKSDCIGGIFLLILIKLRNENNTEGS
ncbi:MAG: hypothetical protein Q7K11_00700, partial [Candidatus Berkelbacteria bacterium]|nr:hypothetical protein [Candidatus Berkelbacteria bacterium]